MVFVGGFFVGFLFFPIHIQILSHGERSRIFWVFFNISPRCCDIQELIFPIMINLHDGCCLHESYQIHGSKRRK